MKRIKRAIDHHHPVLSRFAICAARVEIVEHRQFFARKFGQRGGQVFDRFHAQEVAASVEARRPDQKREPEAVAGKRCCGVCQKRRAAAWRRLR